MQVRGLQYGAAENIAVRVPAPAALSEPREIPLAVAATVGTRSHPSPEKSHCQPPTMSWSRARLRPEGR